MSISRRHFLGSAIAGSVAGAAGAVHAGEVPAKWAEPKCTGWSWEKPVKPIAAKEIKETVETDVVVIGAGLAGFCAALAAQEAGSRVIVLEKSRTWGGRGCHITAFGSKLQAKEGVKVDYAEVIRRLIAWGQGRMDERLLWQFAKNSGDSFDWLADICDKHGLRPFLWEGYYKGPTYTEFPVMHIFVKKGVDLNDAKQVYGKTDDMGNIPLLNALQKEVEGRGIPIRFRTPVVRILRPKADGAVQGVIAGEAGKYVQVNAKKGVIIATGCYGSNEEMRKCFAPFSLKVDEQIYFPFKTNTGDGHVMAMQIGGVMQKVDNHAATIHLEAGACSYGFLHVNALGERFKNEDVNTQSKSCTKELQPKGGVAWTVYDSNWLKDLAEQLDNNLAGGLFFGQLYQEWGSKFNPELEQMTQAQHIKDGKVVVADTLEELADKMGVPREAFVKTVARYNELAKRGEDVDFGKRAALVKPIVKGPFYAGRLRSMLLAMSGGLHTDPTLHVLDKNDRPIEKLWVAGAAAGDYFGSGDYPTICPGMNHGRAVTFGRLAGILASGKDPEKIVKQLAVKPL